MSMNDNVRLRTYDVVTPLGVVSVERATISEARRWAREAFGVGPKCVSAVVAYRHCDSCDSAPCVCSAVVS